MQSQPDQHDASTHTLLIVVPLRVSGALPGRAEALREDGIGGLRAVAADLPAVLRLLLAKHCPDVAMLGLSAHAVSGDGSIASAALSAVAEVIRE